MKNSKKLLVLVLSLVMLIAAFAMCVSAASDDKATVQYPDGTTAQYVVGETIIPPFGATYAGAGNTLYKNAGDGWKFSVDGAPLASLTITEDLIGKTITASGYDKVYFTVEVTGGDVIYYTNADTANADFEAYMNYMNAAGSTVVLYEDITCGSVLIHGKVSSVYRLDLGGHKLTITNADGTNSAIDCRHNAFYLYSSKEGGVLDTSKVSYAFRTNDATYDGTRIDGKMRWGEYNDSRSDYGKNLTVYARAMNPDLYGQEVYYYGGTYIQSENSTSNYLMMLGRKGGNSHTQIIRNCTFVVTKAGTGFLWHPTTTTRTYENCNFINLSGGDAPVFGSNGAANTMKNCSFYNTNPAATFGNSTVVNYTGETKVAFTGVVPERPAGEFLAHGVAKLVAVEGKTYAIDGVFVTDTSSVYSVNWGGVYTDYWMAGATPVTDASALNYIVENANGTALYYGGASYEAQDVVTDDMIGTVGYVEVSYDSAAPLAMKWTLGGVLYTLALDDLTAAEIGQIFYETFDQIDAAADIKLYADLVLPEAVGFGPLGKSDSADEYKSFTKGNVTLDLNGHKFEVSADAKGINPSNSNDAGSYPKDCHGVFAFEVSSSYTFTIKSSIAGAEIVNNAPFALIAIGEGSGANLVIDGYNITYTGEKAFLHSFEAGSANVQINGGTYNVTGKSTAFSGLFNVSIKDAKIIMTGDDAVAVLGAHTWKKNVIYTLENVVISSKKMIPIFSFVGNGNYAESAPADGGKTFSLVMKDCAFAGVDLAKNTHLDTYTISGVTKADTENGLLAVYGSKPAGTTLVKYVVDLNGKNVTFLGYGKASETFTVTYGGADAEYYLVGSLLAIPAADEIADTYYDDDVFVDIEGYIGDLANEIVTTEMAGKTADAFANINYVEKELAFVIVQDGVIVSHVLLDVEDIGAELAAAFAAQAENFKVVVYTDLDATETLVLSAECYINLNGYKLTIYETIENAALIEIENGAIVALEALDAVFAKDVFLQDAAVYSLAGEVLLTNAAAELIDSNFYNILFPEATEFAGTVLHTDENVGGAICNDHQDYIFVGDELIEVSYTRAITDVPELVATATFTYKGEVKGTVDYFIGSIPGFYAEAIEGYYYSFVTDEYIYEDASFECIFVADESKLKGQIVVTEALNFIFYLQKQEGIESIVFNGNLLIFDEIAVEEIDGVDYYVIPVEFETFADCLLSASLEVGVAFGDDVEIITAEVSLFDYAYALFEDELVSYEDKATLYALLAYVDSIIEYFAYDVENEIPYFLANYADYETEYAPVATEQITSDYIHGVLFIVDEQVSLAMRVDADFKGEIIVSVPGEDGVKATFIYKNIQQIDGNYYVVLEDVPFCELAEGYDIDVKMYGELVESFNYSIADYANAMTVQNMGYVPAYARALSVFATLAANCAA